MTGAFSASPLTVWVGPMRYVFHPGRDVVVGYGSQCDIPLDRPGNRAATSQTARPVLVLRFSGTHWVAIDRSPDGIFGMFVDGARVSTIDIRDGQAIRIGDPQRGPRLILGVGAAAGPPAPNRPDRSKPARPDTAHYPANATTDIPASPPTSQSRAASAAGRIGAADRPDSWARAGAAGKPGTDRADEHHGAARHSSCAQVR